MFWHYGKRSGSRGGWHYGRIANLEVEFNRVYVVSEPEEENTSIVNQYF